jgi:outer membrane protein assembly factor BamB
VIWGDKVFLLSANPADATRYVLAIDTSSGQVLWQRRFDSALHHLHARNTFASGTPAVDQHHVYVAWSTPEQLTLRALDHDGREIWSRNLGTWVSQHGFGSSPIVYEDLVILVNSQQSEQLEPGQQPGQSRVMAFDRTTGDLRWTTPRSTPSVSYATPCIYHPPGGSPALICCDTGDGIYSLDPATGKVNWDSDVFQMRTVASPLLVGDLVLGSNGVGGFANNYLVAVDARTGKKAYGEIKRVAYVSTPVAYGDLVFSFYDRGFVHCFDGKTGNEVWYERVTSGFSGSPIRVRDKLYCIDDEGVVIVLAADRKYRELARNPLGEPSRATPAVSGGRMFLRTKSQLICVGRPET